MSGTKYTLYMQFVILHQNFHKSEIIAYKYSFFLAVWVKKWLNTRLKAVLLIISRHIFNK